MRTVPFQSILHGILRKRGMDPIGDAILMDAALTLVERINTRLDKAWNYWEWPEMTVTEERAWRQIWSATRQFSIIGENGQPDEVFYIPNIAQQSLEDAAYYQVMSNAPGDPPIGDPPTDTTYWQPLDPLDRFVALDQICQRSIDYVIGVYSGNPRELAVPKPLRFRISEKGIDVYCYGGLTVWVQYHLRPERFTSIPFIAGRQYQRGDLVYHSPSQECWKCLAANADMVPPTSPNYWRQCQFPEFLAEHIKQAVFADTLREKEKAVSAENANYFAAITRQQVLQDADAIAQDYLENEIILLQAQGQHYAYLPFGKPYPPFGRPYPYIWPGSYYGMWIYSPPWVGSGGSTITSLTDKCAADSFQPLPPSWPTVSEQYHPEIVSLTGPEPSLAGLNPAMMNPGSLVRIVITVAPGNRQEQTWEVAAGAADPADPGQVQPQAYNSATNNKHYARVG